MVKQKKVAVGISGGVDSSVAAHLLKKAGHEVTCVYLHCWEEKADGCSADEDKASAVAVAAKLGIKIKMVDFSKEYEQKVISHFYKEYEKGRTPNPDVLCNKEIKFGLYLDWAVKNEFDFVATGHYARIKKTADKKYQLLKGVDESKDQSYFLYLLNQKQLSKTIFPLGELKKEKVRQIAKDVGLPTAQRPDSQGICFIGKVDVKEFLKRRIKQKKGELLFTDGSIIGEHDGVWFYTIGQRHGFRVNRYFGLPLYVVDKDVKNNKLIVGYAKDVLQDEFMLEDLHWLAGNPPETLLTNGKLNVDVRIRHLGKLHPSILSIEPEAQPLKNKNDQIDLRRLKVNMQNESFGVASGQSAVFYKEDVVLGGGTIC